MSGDQKDVAATEEAGSTPLKGVALEAAKEQPRGFLASGRRNLSEEELAAPAARRFLIFEIERLDSQCVELREVERQHNDLRVEHAILKEAAKQSKWNEVLSFVCLTVGSAGIGAAPSYITASGLVGLGWVFLIGSTVLVLVGIASRVLK